MKEAIAGNILRVAHNKTVEEESQISIGLFLYCKIFEKISSSNHWIKGESLKRKLGEGAPDVFHGQNSPKTRQ